ncbi:hypothetical protein [Legionella gresilensis]|uniref:hypothetical protein n=1 Tax=Legionella gresilensis TaxID=91823 RepID=UPI001040F0F3|nr:hypothetical protein [Legionella gresilensis]
MPTDSGDASEEKDVPSLKEIVMGAILKNQGLFKEAISPGRINQDLQQELMLAKITDLRREVMKAKLINKFIEKFKESDISPKFSEQDFSNLEKIQFSSLDIKWVRDTEGKYKLEVIAQNEYMGSDYREIRFQSNAEEVLNKLEEVMGSPSPALHF